MCAQRIVDLSPEIAVGLKPLHTVPQKVEVTVHSKPIPPGTHWQGTSISIYTHTGAHIDALIHVRANGWSTERISLDQVIGEGRVLDFSHKKASEAIDVDELKSYEDAVQPGDILLLRTDWSDKYYGKPEFFSDSPYVTEEGARWLADRRPKVVGFDFTEDFCIRDVNYDPRELYCHQTLLGDGIPILEGLTNLSSLPVGRSFQCFAPFVKLAGSDGSLARVFALIDEEE
jgi:arylformamidase